MQNQHRKWAEVSIITILPNLQKHFSDLILLQRFAMSATKCHYEDDEVLTLPLPSSLRIWSLWPLGIFLPKTSSSAEMSLILRTECALKSVSPPWQISFCSCLLPHSRWTKVMFCHDRNLYQIRDVCVFENDTFSHWRWRVWDGMDGDDKAEWNTAERPSDAFQTQV